MPLGLLLGGDPIRHLDTRLYPLPSRLIKQVLTDGL